MPTRQGCPRRRHSTEKQQGAALIVGLLLLILMTILGAASFRSIKSGERMAGNIQDENIAFQASEAALREGEAYLESPALDPFNGAGGLYRYIDDSAPAPTAFNASNSRSYSKGLVNVSAPPRYIIEQMEATRVEGESLVVGTRYGGAQRTIYRITAMGYGGSSTTHVALQSTFRR